MEQQIKWQQYSLVAQSPQGRKWLSMQAQLGLAPNTIDAYGRSLQDYFSYTAAASVVVENAHREHVVNYVHHLANRPNSKGRSIQVVETSIGLGNATLQQRLTVVRLFYDYLIEEGLRQDNPVGRGKYTPSHGFGGLRQRALIPKFEKMPWIPSQEQWQAILLAAGEGPLRNQFMLALSYDVALRREELCSLTTADFDPAHQLLRIRAETTKNRKERVIPYSETTALLYGAYLKERRGLSLNRGPLFLSASKRNYTAPISIWTWSKVIEGLAKRSGVTQFTTHTPRHLCLTDLARANWDIHQIALFAGHRSIQTTLLYIHLSGRDLKTKIEQGMTSIHASRITLLRELLP